ncbi:MAG: ribulose-phosphate 3-epimerase, partial [Erysipelotrichaceae bacterium]|nr:ribulose-phosphate 3-epimerase [Erysipelotrichaceae bacterium]
MIIAPSVLSADYTELKKEMSKVNRSKAEWIHYDVMDGHFVPNMSFGPDILKAINRLSDKFIDVHIMVDNPLQTLEYFKGCRIDLMTFHYEAAENNIREVVQAI